MGKEEKIQISAATDPFWKALFYSTESPSDTPIGINKFCKSLYNNFTWLHDYLQ